MSWMRKGERLHACIYQTNREDARGFQGTTETRLFMIPNVSCPTEKLGIGEETKKEILLTGLVLGPIKIYES